MAKENEKVDKLDWEDTVADFETATGTATVGSEAIEQAAAMDPAKEEDMLERDVDLSLLDNEPVKSAAQRENSGRIEQVETELLELKGAYLRALADLENYKKRAIKERSELLKYQGEKVLFDVLEIADNLDLALNHSQSDPEKLREGVALIYKLLIDMLNKWQVAGQSALGEVFDPTKHHAISSIPVHDAVPGTVLNELKKAYFYKDKLLREGLVVVAVEPKKEEEDLASAQTKSGLGAQAAENAKNTEDGEDS